jgi:hypothetical protein
MMVNLKIIQVINIGFILKTLLSENKGSHESKFLNRNNSETPCITYTNKKVFFSQMENKKVKQFLSGGWHQWEGAKVNVVEMSCTHV